MKPPILFPLSLPVLCALVCGCNVRDSQRIIGCKELGSGRYEYDLEYTFAGFVSTNRYTVGDTIEIRKKP